MLPVKNTEMFFVIIIWIFIVSRVSNPCPPFVFPHRGNISKKKLCETQVADVWECNQSLQNCIIKGHPCLHYSLELLSAQRIAYTNEFRSYMPTHMRAHTNIVAKQYVSECKTSYMQNDYT